MDMELARRRFTVDEYYRMAEAGILGEEMTLRELRKARKLTQVRMAESLGIPQAACRAPSA